MQRPDVSERVAAGRWLEERLPAGTPILTDAYAYLPPEYTHVEETFGLTRRQIDAIHPRVIMTVTDIRNRFLDPSAAARYAGGAAAYQEIAASYMELESERMACYPFLKRFGSITIYGRLDEAGGAGGC